MITRTIKILFIATICAVILAPAVQFVFQYPRIDEQYLWLAGKTEKIELPVFSFKDWLEEKYQSTVTAYLENTIGYRTFFIRGTNEWHYKVYRDVYSNMVVGKDDGLYWKEYVEAYIGANVIGYDSILHRCQRARQLQQKMDSMGKKCLFVMLPGKASNTIETIPDHYIWRKKTNNYELLKKAFTETDITYIDLYSYFQQIKKTAKYPLFPKYGTHWSIYAGGLGADTIIRYLQQQWHYNFNQYYIDTTELSNNPRFTDADMYELLNIVSEIPQPELAYPHYVVDTTRGKMQTAKMLMIGDSYMFTLHQSGLMPAAAGENLGYIFYGKGVRDHNTNETGKKAAEIDLAAELEKTDVVVFVFTEINQEEFDFDMCERFLKALENKKDGTN
ncbi:MAG TPA: hypothetical protein VK154_17350 [Chitinophagales bacterium]|nr:hypothetical protein [Chitinophagales bacterium]